MERKMVYGKRIRELREERELSMKELAKKIDASDASICKWENQETEPKLSYLLRLAEFFECSADYLIGRIDDFGGICENNHITFEEKQLVELYRTLSPKVREIFVDTMQLWKNKQ